MKARSFFVITLLALFALALAACGGGGGGEQPAGSSSGEQPAPAATEAPASGSAGDPAAGEQLFVSTCAACHGPEGQGIEGLGKNLATSEFVSSQSDDELVEFIKVGRGPTDPGNTTGIAMPPKGGNPALTDENLYDIVAFIRTLQQ